LSVIRRPLPISDECTTATLLELGQGTYGPVITSSNIGVTDSGVQHSCGTYSGGDVWFEFVAPPSGQVIIEVSNDDDDVVDNASLYDGNCSNPIQCQELTSSTFIFSGLNPSTTYKFAVYENGNSSFGLFDICAYDPGPSPGNDNCENATALAVGPGVCGPSVTATNLGATDSEIDHNQSSCHADYLGGDIWFSFVAPASGEVSLQVSNDPDDIADDYVLYQACTEMIEGCGALSSSTPEAFTGLTPGTIYNIAIWETRNNGFGSFDICAFDPNPLPPSNDECTFAQNVVVNGPCHEQQPSGATQTFPGCSANFTTNANDDVWFSFNAPGPEVTITVTGGSDYDAVLELYTSCNLSDAVSGSCTDNSLNRGETETYTATNLTANVTYYFRVYDFHSDLPTTGFETCVTGPNNCPVDFANGGLPGSSAPLTGAQDLSQVYQTSGDIISDQVIGGTNPTIEVTYSAGTSASSITLQSDFEVKLGVVFDAVMDGCN